MGQTNLGTLRGLTNGSGDNFSYNEGLRTYVGNAENSNFFAGTWDFDQSNLDNYDPFVSGYAYIFWTKLPSFFPEKIRKRFKHMTEKNFKSLSGSSDLTLDFESITGGFAGNSYDAATNLKKGEGGFTLKHQEYMGSPIRELYEYWVTGIRDPETGLATYHGRLGDSKSCPYYSSRFHSGELLYIVTDPAGAAGGAQSIEYACYYTNVIPTKVPQSHLDYSSGEHGTVEIDQEFKGVWHRSKRINDVAARLIKNRKVLESYMNYGDGSSLSTKISDTEPYL